MEELDAMSFISPAAPGDSPAAGVSAAADDRAAALERALAEDMQHVEFHDTPEALVAAMAQPLARCTRAVVLIAAPTSGWPAIKAYVQTASELVQKYTAGAGESRLRVAILAGSRFEVMGKCAGPCQGLVHRLVHVRDVAAAAERPNTLPQGKLLHGRRRACHSDAAKGVCGPHHSGTPTAR